MLRVTVDTNVLSGDLRRMREASKQHSVEIATTTVSKREAKTAPELGDVVVTETGVWNESQWDKFMWGSSTMPVVAESGVHGESRYDSGAVYGDSSAVVHETAVVGEWRAGEAVAGSRRSASRFEAILAIIGDGSFPKLGARETLTAGQRRQLRDAMILEAHARDGRDVLVSNDRRAFVGKDGLRRRRLEAVCLTKIRTVEEFCADITALAGAAGIRRPAA